MILIDGKFYDKKGGTEIPLQFGNKEQIKLIQYATALVDGIIPYVAKVNDGYAMTFNCPCGQKINIQEDYEPTIECSNCKTKYSINHDDEIDFPIIKLEK